MMEPAMRSSLPRLHAKAGFADTASLLSLA